MNLNPKHTKIVLGYTEMPDGRQVQKEYGMLFNLNAIDAIQDKFDICISEFGDMMIDERKMFKAMKAFITIAINEAIDDCESGEPHVTEDFVGRKIQIQDLLNAKSSLFMAFTTSMPDKDEEEDDVPNEKSVQ